MKIYAGLAILSISFAGSSAFADCSFSGPHLRDRGSVESRDGSGRLRGVSRNSDGRSTEHRDPSGRLCMRSRDEGGWIVYRDSSGRLAWKDKSR